MAPVLPTCSYFNDETLQWDTAGCSVAEFNSTHVRCNCTHFTLFAVLAPKHNKVVPSEILDLTPANIAAHPTGLVTVMIILCLFAVMFMAAVLVDRAEAAKYEELRLSKQEKWKSFAAENRKATLLKQVRCVCEGCPLFLLFLLFRFFCYVLGCLCCHLLCVSVVVLCCILLLLYVVHCVVLCVSVLCTKLCVVSLCAMLYVRVLLCAMAPAS